MANSNQTTTSTVILDGKQAQEMLKLLKDKAKELRLEMIELNKVNDKEGFDKKKAELKALSVEMNKLKTDIFNVEAVMKNLNGVNFNDLQKAQKAISSELKKMVNGTDEYIEKTKQLQQVNERLREVKTEMNGVNTTQKNWLGGAADGFNKYFAVVTAGLAAFTGISMGIHKVIDDAEQFESKVANLSALTGLKGSDLDWLGDKAKELSTTTTESGIRITKSAGDIVDAFTKMGSAKPELLKNKDALAEVTKQALILSEAAKMDLDVAVQGLANTMNQFNAPASDAARYINVLGAGAQAGAKEVPYISEAITKFGAMAKISNVNIEQSVALIETLGEKGIEAEVAGTGIKEFFVKLMTGANDTNPKLVGMETALDNLAKKFSGSDGMNELTKTFGERAVVVAASLIDNRDRFKELTTAVTGSNVAYEQALTNTDTHAAKLEQAKNKAELYAIALGEKLEPIMAALTIGVSKLMQGIIWLTGGMDVQSEKMQKEKDNVNALTMTLLDHNLPQNARLSIYNELKKIAPEILEGINKEKISIEQLTANLKKYNDEAIKKIALQSQSESLVKKQKQAAEDLISFTQSEKALAENYNKLLDIIKQKKGDTIYKAVKIDYETNGDLEKSVKKMYDMVGNYSGGYVSSNLITAQTSKSIYLKSLEEAKKAAQEFADFQKKLGVKVEEQSVVPEKKSGIGVGGGVETEGQKKKAQELKDYLEKLREENREWLLSEDEKELSALKFKQKEELEAHKGQADILKELEIKHQNELTKLDNDQKIRRDKNKEKADSEALALKKEALQKLLTKEEENSKQEQTIIVDKYNANKLLLNKQFADKQITEKEFNAKSKDLKTAFDIEMEKEEEQHLQRMIVLKKASGEDTSDLELQLAQKKRAQVDIDNTKSKTQDIEKKQIQEINKFAIESAKTVSNAIFEITKSRRDAEVNLTISNLEKQKAKELENKNLTEAQKTAINDKYAAQEKKIKEKQWKANQEASAIQALINGALAVTNILATMPKADYGIATALAIAASVVTTAAQEAVIISQPMPQFEKGLYPAVGASDGETYQANMISNVRTGMVNSPAILVGEKPEMVIDSPTLKRLSINFPEAINAIYAARQGGIPQYEMGLYPQYVNNTNNNNANFESMIKIWTDISTKLDKEFKAKVVYSDLQDVQNKVSAIANDYGG